MIIPFPRLVMLSVALISATTLPGAHWPKFRGPNANGVISDGKVPVTWSSDENIRWKVSVPGRGWSSPVVWGDKVFLTTAVLKTPGQTAGSRRQDRISTDDLFSWEVYCLNRMDGSVVWKTVALEGHPRIPAHTGNTYASETPVTDGERLYVYFGMMGLFCYDLDGALVWKKDLGSFPMDTDWGTSTSPVLHEGTVYQQIDNEEKSFLVALDAKTGAERWRIPREENSNWSTPVVWKNSARTELVVQGLKTRSYDLKNGNVLWELNLGGGRNIISPVPDGDRLFVGNEKKGGGGLLFAIKAGASGDITPKGDATTSAGVLWATPNSGIEMSSPLIYQGFVYLLSRRNGLVYCYNADTGDVAYYRTPIGGAGEFWASPWGYDGKVFCLDASGTTHVLATGPELKRIQKNTLEDQFWATPAVTPGMLIMRGTKYVYGIEAK
jgi:outer membrane protein assembly factor BamB